MKCQDGLRYTINGQPAFHGKNISDIYRYNNVLKRRCLLLAQWSEICWIDKWLVWLAWVNSHGWSNSICTFENSPHYFKYSLNLSLFMNAALRDKVLTFTSKQKKLCFKQQKRLWSPFFAYLRNLGQPKAIDQRDYSMWANCD